MATEPGNRDFGAEMAALQAQAQAFAQAQAQAQAQANEQMLKQNLRAVSQIAGNLSSAGGPVYEWQKVKGKKGQPDTWKRVQIGQADANTFTERAEGELDAAAAQVPKMDALAGRMDALSGLAEADVAGTEIEAELQKQALADLRLGRELSPEQERAARLSARQAFADRGMAVGPASAAAEILNRDAMATMREDARRGFAGQVNQANTGNRLARLSQAGNLLGQTAGTRQNAAGLGLSAAQGYVALDPYQRALGSNIPIATQQNSSQMVGNAFQGLLGYAQDLNNTNFNAQWSNYLNKQNMATANRMGQMQASAAGAAGNQALMGSGLAAGGAILGGVAIAF